MKKNRDNIIKFPKKRINPGIVVFAVIIIYIAVSMLVFMTREKVSFYEVVYGKNATAANKSYTALIYREERCIETNEAGYVNYYINEGGRASLNSIVYSIDEKGTLSQMLAEYGNEQIKLSEGDINKINSTIISYTSNYDNMRFDRVYEFKEAIDSTVTDAINLNALNSLNELIKDETNSFKTYKADETGLVAFYKDGYENYSPVNISEKDFDQKKYFKNHIDTNELLAIGDFVYKLVNDEEWDLYIKLTNEEYEKYKGNKTITIQFLDKELQCSGGFNIITGQDGYYGKITLDAYVGEFINQRFVDIKIVEKQTTGLKIPKTSVVEKEFYVIPVSFIGKGGNSSSEGFFKQQVGEDGQVSIEFINPSIYSKSDEYYYVSTEEFSEKDVIVMNDSSAVYGIGLKDSLKGVYNINNGYCIFKVIDIIGETSDYYIVNANTKYGLVVYDHIVLNGKLVKENQIIFKVD